MAATHILWLTNSRLYRELKKGLELLGPAAENMSEEQIRTLLSDFKKRRDDLAENMKYESIFLRLHYESVFKQTLAFLL